MVTFRVVLPPTAAVLRMGPWTKVLTVSTATETASPLPASTRSWTYLPTWEVDRLPSTPLTVTAVPAGMV